MRKFVWMLYTGLAIVLAGMYLKYGTTNNISGSILISTGGLLKATYLIISMRKRNYKPGYELLFLAIGVTLVILGSQLRANFENFAFAIIFTIGGVISKLVFLALFFKKIREMRLISKKRFS